MTTAARPAASAPRFMSSVCCNGLVQFNTYTVAGAHVAVWLVEHPGPRGAHLPPALRGHDVHEPAATDANALALRPWAIRLREVFEAGTVPEKAGLADALLVAADCRPRLGSHGTGPA